MRNKIFVETGNSNIKILFHRKIFLFKNIEHFFDFVISKPLSHYIIVFTGILNKEKILSFLDEKEIIFDVLEKKNIKNKLYYNYNFDTVGIDRIICSEYLYEFLKKDFLFLSFGTALAINSVEKNIFKGGAIFPSNYSIRKTFQNISSLKGFKINEDFQKDNNIFFKNTENSLSNPIYWAIEGIIERYVKYAVENELMIVISGGDKYIPFHVFPYYYFDKNIILKGLEYVFSKRD